MARKTFVSTKKNAPAQAVSSKEAALRSRQLPANGDEDDAHEQDGTQRGGAYAHSPGLSDDSSVVSLDDDDDAMDDEDELMDGEDDEEAVAVEVMPSSVGRGKQLRFPMGISRGKESRVHHSGSEYATSDSDSAAGVDSEEDDEDGEDATIDGANHTADGVEKSAAETGAGEEIDYPIKAIRARKRHRPNSDHFADYLRQMTMHVRDCLLSVRDGAGAADVFREETHREFRRKLEAGTAARVEWREAPESAHQPEADRDKSTTAPDGPSKTETHKEAIKKEMTKSEESKREHSSKDSSSGRHHRHKSLKDKKGNESETSSKSSRRSSSEKHRSGRTHSHRQSGEDKRNEGDKKVDVKKVSRSEKKPEGTVPTADVPMEDVTKEPNSVKVTVKSVVTATTTSNGTQRSQNHTEKEPSDQLCASCKRKLVAPIEEAVPAQAIAPATVSVNAPAPIAPVGTFVIPPSSTKDVRVLREQASKLNEAAVKLKHEGDHKGPGPATVEEGKRHLRSSVKFFQQALVLADIKAAYKELNDMHHARSFGDYCIQTLDQTSSLVESTIRTFQVAKNSNLVALAQKMAAIVHLTIYRLQHVKLCSLCAELSPAGRSPDSRPNGTTPPLVPNGSESQETAIRALLMKEMRHMLRGFEMWRRYEESHVDVLPRITNPVVMDLNVLFEDIPAALDA